MSTMRLLTATVIGSALLVSCSQAQFYGTTPARAKTTPTTDPLKALSCSAAPASVKVGEPAVITVDDPAADAELLQTVVIGDKKTEMTLALEGGVYVVKGGAANQVTADQAGHFAVEIRKAGAAAVLASCAFDAASETSATGGTGTPGGTTDGTPTKTTGGTTDGTPTKTTGGTTDGTPTGPTGGTTGGTTDGAPTGTTGGTTGTTTGDVPPGPICTDTEHATGAHIAFLIDNSNSNSATDCPSPTEIETFQGSKVYACQGQTNREKAVMAAFDLLQSVADKEPASAAATSSLSIASFPTRADFMAGWSKETNGMIDVSAANRAATASALGFSRKPFGQTPYDGAITAANELFQGLADDGKARVAVLVTDGEPTDSNPGAVAAKAEALRAQGIQVITVFYSVSQNRALRRGEATQTLYKINKASVDGGHGPWYAAAYANFDAWVKALIGGNGQKSLAETISNDVVEVQNSDALKATFLSIIQKKIVCE